MACGQARHGLQLQSLWIITTAAVSLALTISWFCRWARMDSPFNRRSVSSLGTLPACAIIWPHMRDTASTIDSCSAAGGMLPVMPPVSPGKPPPGAPIDNGASSGTPN